MKHDVSPPTREKLRCELCVWFRSSLNMNDFGECRRNPPRIVILHDGPDTAFPTVEKFEWCGEYSYDEHKDKKGENR